LIPTIFPEETLQNFFDDFEIATDTFDLLGIVIPKPRAIAVAESFPLAAIEGEVSLLTEGPLDGELVPGAITLVVGGVIASDADEADPVPTEFVAETVNV
jgi:hypothetical protein